MPNAADHNYDLSYFLLCIKSELKRFDYLGRGKKLKNFYYFQSTSQFSSYIKFIHMSRMKLV